MATIINTPGPDNSGNGSAAGWVIAVIILILIILFGFFVWPGINGSAPANNAATTGTTNTQPVTNPSDGSVLNVTSTSTTVNVASGTPTTSTTTTTTVTPL